MTAPSGVSFPARRRRLSWARIGRRLVQLGFLLLFLYPFLPVIINRLTYRPLPTLTAWLLPWDPLLFAGQLLHRDWTKLVWGAPLLVLASAWVFGRFFCGWVCPMGTLLDLLQPLLRWRRKQRWIPDRLALFPRHHNSPLRYYILVIVLVSSVFSLKALGLLDPLVVFQYGATALLADLLSLRLPPLRAHFALPAIFLTIVALELWQPRFWCRHLCPLGALLSVFAQGSLIHRRISEACNGCSECQAHCTMQTIPAEESKLCHGNCALCDSCEWGAAVLRTRLGQPYYPDCILCLECEEVCPLGGITLGWARPGGKQGEPGEVAPAPHAPVAMGLRLSRREFLQGTAIGAAGLALPSALNRTQGSALLRPPGALPEAEFLHTCIACQECVRVCPTGALRPVTFEAGLVGLGTPRLVPLQGACSLDPSCPDLCARVCPVGAILPIQPAQMKIGLAKVNRSLCLGWDQETKCLVCVEACVARAAQIYNGRVIVDATRCTGCGRCEYACPIPGSAIKVTPW